MEPEHKSRLGIALAISLGAHILFGVVAEAGSGGPSQKPLQAPPVEITRVAADGTTLPDGAGKGTFNSPSSALNQSFGQRYELDAGVPMKLNQPPPRTTPQTNPQAIQRPNNPQTQAPINAAPENKPQPPNNQRNPSEFPVYQGSPTGQQGPNTPASQPSTMGNQGQKRSKGPNRAAFPEYTVEPNVAQSMIGGGVTNSVDVSVSIAPDGSHTEQIIRSSGSSDVDALVLDALKQWRWDPAAREGEAIASTQNFKFTFKPR